MRLGGSVRWLAEHSSDTRPFEAPGCKIVTITQRFGVNLSDERILVYKPAMTRLTCLLEGLLYFDTCRSAYESQKDNIEFVACDR